MGSDCGGDGPAGGNHGGSPGRGHGGSPDRGRGGPAGGNRAGSPSSTLDRGCTSQFHETRDYSSRSSSTSPARDRNLLGMGIHPQDYQRSDQQASTSGTSHFEVERLRERLSKMQAVKDRIERRRGKVFKNIQAGDLQKELATAERLGVKPMHVDDPGFGKIAHEEDIHMKWAVTQSGDLLFVPYAVRGVEISHTVLTKGGLVIATGEALIFSVGNKCFCAEITKHSGHYRPDESSLEIGKQAFKVFGITFLCDDSGNGGSGTAAQQASTSSNFRDETLQYVKALDTVKNIKYARELLVELLTERLRRIQEVEKAANIAGGEINSNKAHHIFDQTKHNWDLTGLDRQGNWDLIQTTLLNKYEKLPRSDDSYNVNEPFGNYKVTVTGKVVNGAVRISNAWVNPL